MGLGRMGSIAILCNTRFEVDTKYVHIKAMGKGAYGVVCSSLNKETSEKVAIKKIADAFDNRIDAIRTLREVKILRQLRHENVIALKDIMMPIVGRSFKDVYLVYELMDTDLNQVIKSSQPLSRNQIHCLLFQLLWGLNYVHSANILHCDLKPGNIIVNANCDMKICDVGLARDNRGQFMTEYVAHDGIVPLSCSSTVTTMAPPSTFGLLDASSQSCLGVSPSFLVPTTLTNSSSSTFLEQCPSLTLNLSRTQGHIVT